VSLSPASGILRGTEPRMPERPPVDEEPTRSTDSITVTAWHPSPVAYVPHRGRKTRLGFDRIATPVTLAVAPDEDLAPLERRGGDDVAADFYQDEAFAMGDAAYVALRHGGGDVAPEAFVAFLSGRTPDTSSDLWRQLDGTPLFARPPAVLKGPSEKGDPGMDLDAAHPRSVSFRDGGHAAAALRRFLAEDIVVTPTRVLLRKPPFGQCLFRGGESDVYLNSEWHFSPEHPPLVRPDRIRQVEDHWREPNHAPLAEGDVAVVAARFPERTFGDDDLLRLANVLPSYAVRMAEEAMTMATMNGIGCRERVGAERDALLPWDLRGRIGSIGRHEAAHALASSVQLLRTVEANVRCSITYLGYGFGKADRLMAYVEKAALRRLGAAPTEVELDDDVAALGALAP
jgi:hypothetical protein